MRVRCGSSSYVYNALAKKFSCHGLKKHGAPRPCDRAHLPRRRPFCLLLRALLRPGRHHCPRLRCLHLPRHHLCFHRSSRSPRRRTRARGKAAAGHGREGTRRARRRRAQAPCSLPVLLLLCCCCRCTERWVVCSVPSLCFRVSSSTAERRTWTVTKDAVPSHLSPRQWHKVFV